MVGIWGEVSCSFFSEEAKIDRGFPGDSVGKESACNVGDLGWIPGLGRSPRGGNVNSHSSILTCRIPWTEDPGRV